MQADLTDVNTLKRLLARHGFTFSKGLGQNFLTDPGVCPRMAALCGAEKEDGALEIGPGAGVLTRELAKTAKRVVSIEADARLLPVLSETLTDCRNVQVLCRDALKTDLAAVVRDSFSDCRRVFVCANLPYYITSPVLTALLDLGTAIAGITVMVQQEAAERLTAEVGDRNAGAITAAVRVKSEPRLLFTVPRTSFTPAPKVDSAVIRLTPLASPPVDIGDGAWFFRVVKAAFAQRRKTAVNGLSSGLGIPKTQVSAALSSLGMPPDTRAETLPLADLAALAAALQTGSADKTEEAT